MAKIIAMKKYFFSTCLAILASNIVGEIARPRGVPISKSPLYTSGGDFTCLDGSGVIPFERINDDYCDCNDASDEPGTSACPNGSFHCTNAGYRPKNLPTSWVNDGICDCCDGTDEYESNKCLNTCRDLGKQMREEAERTAVLVQEGHRIYLDYVEQGRKAKAEQEERKVQLENLKDEAAAERSEMEVFKEEAEKPETEAKEVHKKAWEEEKEKLQKERDEKKQTDAFHALDVNQDGFVSTDEMQRHLEFDIDSNSEVSYEEAKEYLEDNDQIDLSLFSEKVWPNIKEIYRDEAPATDTEKPAEASSEPTEEPPEFPELDEGDTDEDDSHDEDESEDQDFEDSEEYEVSSSTHKARGDMDDHYSSDHLGDEEKEKPEENQMLEYDEATKELVQVADKAREAFNEADKKFKSLESEFNELTKFLELDLGPNLEFYPLKGECYEFSDSQYTYKMCPFERASQRSKSGGMETNLGHWGKWNGPESNLYSVMQFDHGQNCWNGPDRSVKVLISCGKSNELLATSEPNRCEYEFKFITPAACSKLPKAPESNHDEL